jgi:2-methylcitrate dehydratase PrpD
MSVLVQKEIGPTRALAEYVVKASYDDLPQPVREKAKLYILDSIGNMIGGSALTAAKIILDLFQEMGGKAESTILATGRKIPCMNAAYVNAALSNLLDFDDTYANWFHPGCTSIPPALAVAEKVGANGKDFINAVVLGYEVSLRVGLAVQPTQARFREVAGLSTPQIFGAVTVAAKLLKLDVEKVITAFGHAGFNAPVPNIRKWGMGLGERPLTWMKNNMGWASAGGVLAAFLAEKGFVGNRSILDGDQGFWVMSGSDQCDFARYTGGFGERYLMVETGFKPYASCRWTHTVLDAVYEILSRTKIEVERVRKIRVRGYSEFVSIFCDFEPAYIIDAQFSIPALVALAVAGYSPAHGLSESHLRDKKVTELMGKIHVEGDAEADKAFAERREVHSTVTIEMEDGEVLEVSKRIPKWEPDQPPSRDELEAKFMDITGPVLGKRKVKKIMDGVRELDVAKNVQALTGI